MINNYNHLNIFENKGIYKITHIASANDMNFKSLLLFSSAYKNSTQQKTIPDNITNKDGLMYVVKPT